MAMKMKILHYPEKGKIVTFTNLLSNEYQQKADKIPPAYDCSRERLLFVGISSGKIIDSALSLFLRGLTTDKVQNVAIFTDAADATVEEMKAMIAEAGAKVLDVKKVKGSFLPFLTGVKPEEAEDLKTWAAGIVAQLQD
ncbi:MAG: hypothetical protein IJV98_03505 [Clostridia bacterium]|nr:hypothetical protein [Clostridia bacterium]